MAKNVKSSIKLLAATLVNALAISFFIITAAFFIYHLIFSRRVVPGVSVAGKINLSGKSFGDALENLREKTELFAARPLALEISEASSSGKILRHYDLYLESAGLTLDPDKTAEMAYRVGRSGSIINDLAAEIRSLLRGNPVAVAYRVDEDKFSNYLSLLEKDWGSEPQNATFSFVDGELQITPSHPGILLGRTKAREMILSLVSNLNLSGTLALSRVSPAITTDDLVSLQEDVKKAITRPVTLSGGAKAWELKPEEILTLTAFHKDTNGPVYLTVDRDKVTAFIQKLALEINEPSRGQILEFDGTRVAKFIPGQNGLELDDYQAINLITRSLYEASTSVRIQLPVKEVPAPPASANAYGIKDLLGEGTTNFAGSIPGRIHNIALAAGRLNGVLIAPGTVFSFNNSVGEVSAQTGYDEAYIISEGRTVLGTGGGLCQVSSTIFRASLFAGLPIIKRTAHAYRVHYYEPPVGFDATVFAPALDFQFSNDTQKYILVTSEINGENLTFRLYGTNDGRSVETKGPFISREIAPPAPLYQDDPSLPAGVTQQVDWSAWGADVYFSRLVKRGAEILQNDTFQSHYQAWQAIFLRGTKT